MDQERLFTLLFVGGPMLLLLIMVLALVVS